MKVKMLKNRGWRGGVLLADREYQLPNAGAAMLIREGSAVEVTSPSLETSTVGPEQTAMIKTPTVKRKRGRPRKHG